MSEKGDIVEDVTQHLLLNVTQRPSRSECIASLDQWHSLISKYGISNAEKDEQFIKSLLDYTS